ncbi:MAG: tetratricopeptide repeat protein [Bacteroidia bacterium]
MSNNFKRFLLCLAIFLPAPVSAKGAALVDSLLMAASEKYDYENFTDAIPLYEQLLLSGYVREDILYRLAYMYEKKGNYPVAIFYLRTIQWKFGGNRMNEKIGQLVENANRERLSSGEEWTGYRLWVQHHFIFLIWVLGGLALSGGMIFFRKLPGTLHAIAIISSVAAVVLGLMLTEHIFFAPKRAVLIRPTSFYDEPAYGANYRSLPIGQGATVNLIESQDIWSHISMGQFDTWVPTFVIRQIEP